MGALVAMLSVTGVVIWMRKRKARVAQKRKVKEESRSGSGSPQPAIARTGNQVDGRESTSLS
jgi:uncharacterized iron-regulated membrane protein